MGEYALEIDDLKGGQAKRPVTYTNLTETVWYRTLLCACASTVELVFVAGNKLAEAALVLPQQLEASMTHSDDAFTSNLLLSSMSAEDLALLKPSLTRLEVAREQVLCAANELIRQVYFLEGGIASIVSTRLDSGRTEVGIFGREGVSGTAVLMGVNRSPHETFMQVDGTTVLRIGSEQLIEAMDQSRSLTKILMAFTHTMMVQTAACAVGNAHHLIEARLARWLLMCHDRVDGDEIALTHDFMAMMIASRRSGVTVTLHVLEGIGAIRSKRGRVIIVDREKLEDLAGDAYGEPEGEYRRLIGPFGRQGSVLQFADAEREGRPPP